jgi:hypothetical protein
MSEETFDPEEDGFTFSDEDFGRRCFPEQKPHSVADLKNISRRANQQAHSNIVRYSAAATHSCARCAVVSPRLRRTDLVRVIAPRRRSPNKIEPGPFRDPT